MSDMWSTVAAERGALAADLADLSDQQWKTPSLCDGWTVREVLAHGATVVDDLRGKYGPGTAWVVLADPEGNEFCILRSLGELDATTTEP